MPSEITHVQVLSGTRVRLTFATGETGEVDVAALTPLTGVFEPLRNPDYFAQVRVDQGMGTVVWPNGADICPDVLYSAVTGKALPGQSGKAA